MTVTLTIDDIKATIEVIFKQRVANLIKVGTKGRVLFCVKNSSLTPDYRLRVFGSAVFNLDQAEASLEKQIKQIFNGGAIEVDVLEYKSTFASVVEQINVLKWDWIFTTDANEQTSVASYCKEKKKFGLVYNLQSDSMYVVSCNNPSALLADGTTTVSTVNLLPILVGVIAGCPYTQSISYKVFNELKSVELPSTIIEGQCTLYNEEEGVRVASPVNTLLTLTENVTEDMKSIAIVEGMQRLKEDIIYAFRTAYKGKYKNKYDNQCLFYSAVNYYLEQLEDLGVLDPEYDNHVDTNVAKQRQMWIASGKDADEINSMKDLEIKKLTYKNMIYPLVNAKFLDAIEGMSMEVDMY
jgi:hypothetical protein